MSEIRVTAHLSDGIQANADLGKIVEVPVGPDIYEGEYEVTAPSDGDLVLPTKDKLMDDDVTIKANHEIEDELLTGNFTSDVYYNDRITTLRNSAFKMVKNVRVINLPNLSFDVKESSDCFTYTSVEEIYTPKMFGQAWNSFYRFNDNLRILDMGECAVTNIIRSCPKLEILITRRDGVSGPAFDDDAPLGKNGVGGYVYVPQALLEQYRTNANWQTNAHVLEFRPIEGSEYELEE